MVTPPEAHADVAGLSFELADATQLQFHNASFDACRIDRVLQHIAEPAGAIVEMARVLRPDGVLVAFDSDWETLTVDSAERAVTRRILNTWCDRFPSGWIGRMLVSLFLQAGLGDVLASPKTLVLSRARHRGPGLQLLLDRRAAQQDGVISRDDLARWTDELRTADAEGRFFTSYTGFLVSGRRDRAVNPRTAWARTNAVTILSSSMSNVADGVLNIENSIRANHSPAAATSRSLRTSPVSFAAVR